MRRASAFFCLCSALVLASDSALGQATQADRLQFEVASVRRAAPGIRFDGMKGGPGTSDPGRMTWTKFHAARDCHLRLRNQVRPAFRSGLAPLRTL